MRSLILRAGHGFEIASTYDATYRAARGSNSLRHRFIILRDAQNEGNTRYIFNHPNIFLSFPKAFVWGTDIVFERGLLNKVLKDVTPKGSSDAFGTDRQRDSRGGLWYPSAGYATEEVELPTRNNGVLYMTPVN
jgi:hypothetical protein